jgi:phosphate transport system substrate-binding protein
MKFPGLLCFAILALLCSRVRADEAMTLQCTPSLLPLVKDLVKGAKELGLEVKVAQEAGNAVVAADLAGNAIDVALLTRSLTVDERVSNPGLHISETTIGTQVVAVVVARLVWESGIQALKRDQILGLYESKLRNWKDLGGEDRPAQFFEPAHDRGVWEIFASWLYGDIHKAPGVPWQIVADGPETQTALQFSSGAASVAALRWADKHDVFALGIIDDAGKAIEPTKANIVSGAYPLVRPVVVAFPRTPASDKRKFLEFMLGEKGQQIIAQHDYVPQSALSGK